MSASTAVRSAVEWVVAAGGVVALLWVAGLVIRPLLEPATRVSSEVVAAAVPGVPPDATRVSLLMLRDGREIRTGLTHAVLEELLPAGQRAAEPMRSDADGTRLTQTYRDGARSFVVTCDRDDATGQMYVSGIYLP